MQSILLPSKINFAKGSSKNETIVSLEPCYHGYGITIGNALRRVLLSSLPGSAITAVKIEGVSHEFSAIPNVLEDVLQVILNLKQVRLVSHSSEPIKLSLNVSGEKKITAADFEKNSDIKVASPDQHIATLTDPKAEFKMEVIVEQGRGYAVTEERDKSTLEAGMIAIDAIFTPVRNVAVKVENVRVGQITNFDKLLLTVETDGAITPEEAVKESAKILIDHFNIVVSGEGKEVEPEEEPEEEEAPAEEKEDTEQE
ncbi:DNA-directed RNA polymerase subunit alpha [Candidatus Parcubacteria bacterium]|nr:DNA-directed RNA polymerase subunit alpha [Patescibacteria group bacterium]MCG2693760.1 DNA-directed RNA polymerase subunit alpha [Candidatus Parcubacteria bacterium]